MCSRFRGLHVTVTSPCRRATSGSGRMHVWYVAASPVARRLSRIQSWTRARFSTTLGRLPTSGHIRGPDRRRDNAQNHTRYADTSAAAAAARAKCCSCSAPPFSGTVAMLLVSAF
ncbi:hypothetical protein PR202_ga09000 [Eleusine coracana subsp. coracana]|uniref:Uncharacterized protein n=1 Tax=Eleusine coracana subsp. coracana TaxID=191504 RepID=A0AAV5C463_ELECO|nr:hypothetical protein PR202_ga09000 [Eleusine coracana subsp. coracana]